jgi:hypothetical protein
MSTFFSREKYASTGRTENMVNAPVLFLKSVRAKEEAAEARTLKEGPEGKYLRDIRVITHMLKGLLKEIPALFSCRSNLDRRLLLTAFHDSRKQFMVLEKEIGRYDDYRGDEAGHCKLVSAGSSDPADL